MRGCDRSVGDTVCFADGTYGQITLNATPSSPGVTPRYFRLKLNATDLLADVPPVGVNRTLADTFSL